MLSGTKLADGPVPVPVSDIAYSTPRSSITLRVPVRGPTSSGLKTTSMTQKAAGFGGREEGQLFVCVKSPLVTIWVMFRSASPWFASVTCRTGLGVPHARPPKSWDGGLKVAFGAVAAPVRVTVPELPEPAPLTVSDPVLTPDDVGR